MPNYQVHCQLTAEILRIAGAVFPGDEKWFDKLAGEFCNIPDLWFSDPGKFAEFVYVPDGIQFHYPPDTPVSDLYRYFCADAEKGVYLSKKYRNHNFYYLYEAFVHHLKLCVECWQRGDKFRFFANAGCVLHVLEDAVFGLHALEGANGTDLFVLDRLFGMDKVHPSKILANLELPANIRRQYQPVMLGKSVEEIALFLYGDYLRRSETSRKAAFEIVLASYQGKKDSVAGNVEKMVDNAVALGADFLYTLGNLVRENFSGVSDFYDADQLEPVTFPIGGAGYALRSFTRNMMLRADGTAVALATGQGEKSYAKGFAFGANNAARELLFFIPPAKFSSFGFTLGLAPEAVNEWCAMEFEIIVNANVFDTVRLDADCAEKTISIASPAGECGIRFKSVTRGGVVIMAEPILKR